MNYSIIHLQDNERGIYVPDIEMNCSGDQDHPDTWLLADYVLDVDFDTFMYILL